MGTGPVRLEMIPAASKGIESECQVMNRPVGSCLLSRANSLPDRGSSKFGCWD